MTHLRKKLAGAAVATMALTSTALAGGYQRGMADTDILYEPGTFSMRYGMTYVDPERGFDSIDGQSGDFGDYTQAYQIPSFAAGFGGDLFGCAGTYTKSFAAEADYSGSPGGALPAQRSDTMSASADVRTNLAPAASTSRTADLAFDSNEFGLTCRVSYTTDMGRFSLLGGVLAEDFSFEGKSYGTSYRTIPGLGKIPVASTQVDVTSEGDYKAGYRIGAAFEIPKIALRAQVLYRSEVKHDDIQGDGTLRVLSSLVPTLPAGTVVPVNSYLSEATSPQYVTINAQTGIAPGTLLLASFRWTDWSTNEYSISSIENAGYGISSSSYSPYHWRDGYTGSIGLGHAFTDQISGAIQLGYDRGVSTGSETTYTDLYTLAGGVSFKANKWSEIRFGGLVGYWTDGAQSISNGAYFNGTVGDDWVYAANASLKLTF